MSRTFILTVCFLASLLCSHPAAAQSYPNLPSRVTVSSNARTLRVGQVTEIRIALLDQQDQEIGASEDTPINLISTKLKDLSSAKSVAQEGKALPGGVLELPHEEVSAVQWWLAIPRGETGVTVRFRSQQAGTIRIFAENEKLVAGSTLIAVIRNISRVAQTSGFQKVSFQEEPPPPAYSISLEADGTEPPPTINGKWVRKLNVLLKSGEDLVPAQKPIKVILRVESGSAMLSTTSVIIAEGQASSEDVELGTSAGGESMVSARAVNSGQLSISASQSAIPFPQARRATKLLVDAMPPTALANGLEAIQLRVRAVDDGNNPIRAEEEGLPARDVTFRLEGRASGLKFDQGIAKVTIPKGEVAAAINIFGSSPISGTRVIAESENGIRKSIIGVTGIEFSFPWWQLVVAMLGGLIVPPLRTAIRTKRRMSTRRKLTTLAKKGLIGLLVGGLFFVVFFFGAAAMDGLNWSGITINLARFPLHNAVASFAIGVFGSLLIDMRSFFAVSIARVVSKRRTARA